MRYSMDVFLLSKKKPFNKSQMARNSFSENQSQYLHISLKSFFVSGGLLTSVK